MNETSAPHPPNTCAVCGASLSGDVCPRCLMADAAQATQMPGLPSTTAPPSQAEVIAAFPQLEIIEMIGAGGMGTVWRVRQPTLNRFAALKLLPASITERDPAFAERFAREGQLLARLHHPNIVTVHDSGRAGDFFYLLMEFVDGVNLRQAMRASRFTPQQALSIVPKICDALQYAHEEGVLHRDIKPENILLDGKGRVKLVDFGIAKLMTQPESAIEGAAKATPAPHTLSSLTLGDTTLGTPQYMAPEQLDTPSDVDHRADIYSLGVVFYELLTGELPIGKFAPASEKSEADPRVDGIVQQALEKERERRQHSAGEFRTQVENLTSAKPATVEGFTGVPRFSRTAIAGACWAFFIILAAVLWVSVNEGPRHYGVPWYVFDPGGNLRWFATLAIFTILPLGLTAPFGMTMLGWVAVSQIRRSAGKLHGLGLAVFDGLFFPLFALDAVIVAVDRIGRAHEMPSRQEGVRLFEENIPGSIALFLLAVIVVVDLLIIRGVWRAVTRPAEVPTTASGQAPAPNRKLATLAFGCAWAGGILGAITWCLMPRPPMALVWSIPMAAIAAIMLAIPSRKTPRGQWALWFCTAQIFVWTLIWMFVAYLSPGEPPTALAGTTFAPTEERVITVGNDSHSFYSFDRGDYVPGPTDFDPTEEKNQDRFWKWLTQNHVDVFARARNGRPVLIVSEMVRTDLNEDDFDRLTPALLEASAAWRSALNAQFRAQEASTLDRGKLQGSKDTLAFQNRYEVTGLVQVAGVTHDPAGVKIRYRLMQKPQAAQATGGAASPVIPHREVLEAELEQARKLLAMQEAAFKTGAVAAQDVQTTRNQVEILQAKLTGDPVQIAEASLAAARRILDLVTSLFQAAVVSASDLEKAKGDVAVAEAALREARPDAAHHTRDNGKSQSPIEPGQRNMTTAARGKYSVKLPNGVEVSVTAVAVGPRVTNHWWQPDGKPLKEEPADTLQFDGELPGERAKPENEVALLVHYTWPQSMSVAPDEGSIVTHSYFPWVAWSAGGVFLVKDCALLPDRAQLAAFASLPDTMAYRCGISFGPWEQVAMLKGAEAKTLVQDVQVDFLTGGDQGWRTTLSIRHNIDRENFHRRVVAHFKDGKTLTLGLSTPDTREAFITEQVQTVLVAKEVDFVTVERRRCYWAEISDIALHPTGAKTAEQRELEELQKNLEETRTAISLLKVLQQSGKKDTSTAVQEGEDKVKVMEENAAKLRERIKQGAPKP